METGWPAGRQEFCGEPKRRDGERRRGAATTGQCPIQPSNLLAGGPGNPAVLALRVKLVSNRTTYSIGIVSTVVKILLPKIRWCKGETVFACGWVERFLKVPASILVIQASGSKQELLN